MKQLKATKAQKTIKTAPKKPAVRKGAKKSDERSPKQAAQEGAQSFTIDRAKWLRGNSFKFFGPEDGTGEGPPSTLCDSSNRKCCLGFYMLSIGARGIRNHPQPDTMPMKSIPVKGRWLVEEVDNGYGMGAYASEICEKLIAVNDDEDLNESTRERRIASLFAKAGVQVEFTGQSNKYTL